MEVISELDRVARERFLTEASALLGSSLDVRGALGELARLAVPRMADWCMVYAPGAGDTIDVVAREHADPEQRALALEMDRRYPMQRGRGGEVTSVLEGAPSVLCEEIGDARLVRAAHDATHLAYLRTIGFRSAMIAPLRGRGGILGALVLVTAESGRRYQRADLALADELAARASLAVDNARLFQAERAAREAAEEFSERTAQLQRLSSALGDVLVPDDATRFVAAAMREALLAGAAVVWLLDDETGDLVMSASDGYHGEAIAGYERFPIAAHLPACDAVRESRPVLLVSRADRAARYPQLGDGSNAPFHAWAAVPLIVERRALGVLSLSFSTEREFDLGDQAMMMAMGTLCAQAIARTRLFEAQRRARARAEASERALREQEHELRTLYRLGASFAKELDHDRLAQLVTDEAAAVCGAQLGALFFEATTPDGEHALRHATTGIHGEVFARLSAPRTMPIFGPTFRGEAPLRLDDVRLDPRFHALSAQPGSGPVVASYLAVAVITRAGEVLGGLFFGHAEPTHFTEQHERMLVALAGQAAIALENARLYRAVQDSEARARLAERRKDEFLAMLGHELRNPLAPISTALDLMALAGGPFAHEREVIARQVEHMTRLIDDLLDVSRITRGKIELEKRLIEIGGVVAAAIEMVSPLLERRLHSITVAVPARGLVVCGDPTRLAQVVANLLTNAAKYTEAGGKIAITAGQEAGHVVLRVKDDGIGIRTDLLPQIFHLFVQGERTIDRAEGGLGLGLSLVHSIVRMHDGTVEAASEGPGRGSEFTVRIPLHDLSDIPDEIAAGAAAAATTAARPGEGSGKRVLVVDDNVDAADVLADLLTDFGHEVATAHDGPKALVVAERFRPDVALLDIGLPVMDGYELAGRLRALMPGGTLRLVALTGYGQDEDRQRALASGFDEHLVKPVKLDRLLDVLSTTLA